MEPTTGLESLQPAPKPKPTFDISLVLQEITTNDVVASFLFAREKLPPTALGSAVGRCIGIESLAVVDSHADAHVLKKVRTEEDDSGTSDPAPTRAEKEKLEFFCHSVGHDYCFASNTEQRNPVALIEKPCAMAGGVNRSVGMKLKTGPPGSFAAITNLWFLDGRSNLIILCYAFTPVVYTEKYFLLFAPYPEYRYPRMSDILESMSSLEQDICQYCIARGFLRCQCSLGMMARITPALPCAEQRDPWTMYNWCWIQYESSIRKYFCTLKSYKHQLEVTTSVYHIANPMVDNDGMERKSVQFYAEALRPYFNSRMLEWNQPSNTLTANRPRRIVDKAVSQIINDEDQEWSRSTKQLSVAKRSGPANPKCHLSETPCRAAASASQDVSCHLSLELVEPKIQTQPTSRQSLSYQSLSAGLPGVSGFRPSGSAVEMNISSALVQEKDPPKAFAVASEVPGVSILDQFQGYESRVVNQEYAESFRGPKMAYNPQGHDDEAVEPTVADEQRYVFEEYIKNVDDNMWSPGARKSCSFCPNRSFNRKHDLKRHIRSTHLLEREFRCEQCGEKFVRRTHLEIHVRGVHEKSTKYRCDICGKDYAYYSTRSKHMRTVHGIHKRKLPESEDDS